MSCMPSHAFATHLPTPSHAPTRLQMRAREEVSRAVAAGQVTLRLELPGGLVMQVELPAAERLARVQQLVAEVRFSGVGGSGEAALCVGGILSSRLLRRDGRYQATNRGPTGPNFLHLPTSSRPLAPAHCRRSCPQHAKRSTSTPPRQRQCSRTQTPHSTPSSSTRQLVCMWALIAAWMHRLGGGEGEGGCSGCVTTSPFAASSTTEYRKC
jgi:hypothetical protein